MMTIAGVPGALRYDADPAAMLIASATAPDRLAVALDALGVRVVARSEWDAPLPTSISARIVAVEAVGVDADILAAQLSAIADRAFAMESVLVVAMARDQIDIVAAVLLGSQAILLVDPSPADCVAAMVVGAERARIPTRFSESGRESDAVRLERLSSEVARIAEALVQLTRTDAELNSASSVGDRSLAYGAPPVLAATGTNATPVRRMIRARRLRDRLFGSGLFEDPGWDMLLDLYAAELEKTRVSVSSLCIAAAAAPS